MALYAFDGTGNDDRPDTAADGFSSNVLHFFRAFQDPGKDFVEGQDTGSLYLKGIGRRAETHTGTVVSQAFGLGGHLRVGVMMDRLAANLASGDDTVDIIGFSRGAALAVSFANELARRFPSLAVRFLGLWDTVGQFGLPGQFVNAGHDLRMPRTVVRSYHAMALDERRSAFPLTRLHKGRRPVDPRLTEVWFRGVHSDVGGGNGNFGLNWISLDWMYASALREGLPIDAAAVTANRAHGARLQDILEHKVAVGPKRRILGRRSGAHERRDRPWPRRFSAQRPPPCRSGAWTTTAPSGPRESPAWTHISLCEVNFVDKPIDRLYTSTVSHKG